jgi:Helix-turn-helix domain
MEVRVVDNLDELYPAEPIARWLNISVPTLMALARKRKIPAVRFNERLIRFHPRSILAAKGQSA